MSELVAVAERIASWFRRSEPPPPGGRIPPRLLGYAEQKNRRQLAERLCEVTLDSVQHLLARAIFWMQTPTAAT